MYKHTFHSRFLLNIITLSLFGLATSVMAEDTDFTKDTNLSTIQVFGSKKQQPHKYDVSGLAELKKTAEKLQADQVENIRDLVRYDPAIGVNESGGRGTSRGFSMRGVDKERVSINLDGFSPAPILRRYDRRSEHSATTQSSAIGEVEYENLKLVDIRKGSSSTENGSGALGGSVNLTTKEAADFFLNDTDKLAGRVKLGYTSKDLRKVSSFALAGREGKFEGFIQYTHRQGHEIRSHSDLYKGGSLIQYYNPADGNNLLEAFLNATEVSGEQRKIPNPLDYKSDALLTKFGVHLSPSHYLGLVIDHNKQSYFVREMSFPNYHSKNVVRLFDRTVDDQMKAYTPTLFYSDQHKNDRVGIEYKYQAEQTNPYIDEAVVRLDYRNLALSSKVSKLNCAVFPNADPNCQVEMNKTKRGQYSNRQTATLYEKDLKLDFNLLKKLNIFETEHQLQLRGGIINSVYRVDDRIVIAQNKTELKADCLPENKVTFNNIATCWQYSQDDQAYSTGKLKGENRFVGLSDRVDINRYLDLSLGIRFDQHHFKGNTSLEDPAKRINFRSSNYNNHSWDFGIAVKPIRSLRLSYRASTGFRVPSIIEQVGPLFGNSRQAVGDEQRALKSEKSFNQEVGINYTSPILKLFASYFITDYQDIIDLAEKDRNYSYHNVHSFKTHGFDVRANIDAYSLWNKLPEGVELFTNVGIVKIKGKPKIADGFSLISTYAFDAVQPLKVVYGVNYHAPSEKWGASVINTYSKGKDPSELVVDTTQGGLQTQGSRFSSIRTRSWQTTDLTAYYHYNKNVTVRAGVYNLFNYRYITWESARQTSFSPEARISTKNYSILAAPGRNFLVNLEVKF